MVRLPFDWIIEAVLAAIIVLYCRWVTVRQARGSDRRNRPW
jgi:hypothetical protein